MGLQANTKENNNKKKKKKTCENGEIRKKKPDF